MGQVGSAGDNAAMESLFVLLQKNVLDRQRWATRDDLASRSSPGSSAPTTADAARPASADWRLFGSERGVGVAGA